MALVSEDLARTVANVLRIAGKYAGKEPPTSVTIPQDFTNRLLDGNQITVMLQLQMQNQISQETPPNSPGRGSHSALCGN